MVRAINITLKGNSDSAGTIEMPVRGFFGTITVIPKILANTVMGVAVIEITVRGLSGDCRIHKDGGGSGL